MSINQIIVGDSNVTFPLQAKTINIGNVGKATTITSAGTSAQTVTIPALSSSGTEYFVTSTSQAAAINGIPIHQKGYIFPSNWAPNFKARLAALAASPSTGGNCTIAFVGDSITQGLNASSFLTTSYVSLLRQQLQTTYGDGGSGYIGSVNDVAVQSVAGYGPSQTGVSVLPTSAAWLKTQGEGPGSFFLVTSTALASITFTVRGTQAQMFYVTGASLGNINLTIDGGTSVVVPTAGASGVGVYSFVGLAVGNHTIVCTKDNNTTAIAVFGCRGTNPNGVIVDNFSVIGVTSGLYVTRNSIQYGAPWDWSGGQYLPADLVVYAIGVNDATAAGATTSDAFAQNVLTYIQGVKNPSIPANVTSKAEFMFISPAIGNYQTVGRLNYTLISNALLEIANMYNGGLINLDALTGSNWQSFYNVQGWGTFVQDGTGNPGTSLVHPGNIGHQIYYNYILPIFTNAIFTG